MKIISSITISSDNFKKSLQKLTLEDFKLLSPKEAFGIPEFFTRKGRAIKMWPLSKTPYNMEIVYE